MIVGKGGLLFLKRSPQRLLMGIADREIVAFWSLPDSNSKKYKLTQVDLSEKAGVGLRFVRELEQGKTTLRLDNVNKVFELFGSECGPVPMKREGDDVWNKQLFIGRG